MLQVEAHAGQRLATGPSCLCLEAESVLSSLQGSDAKWDGDGAGQSQMSLFITFFPVPAALADSI